MEVRPCCPAPQYLGWLDLGAIHFKAPSRAACTSHHSFRLQLLQAEMNPAFLFVIRQGKKDLMLQVHRQKRCGSGAPRC